MEQLINSKHKFFEISRDIRSLSHPLQEYLGISYFAFKRTWRDGSKIYLFNQPSYYEHWFKNRYYLIGNKEASPDTYQSSYDLWEHLPDPQGLYKEGAECFNITHGLTITKNHGNYCDFFFYATNRENIQVKKLYFNRREVFENFCDYFLEAGSKMIKLAEKHKPIMPFAPKLEIITKDKNIDAFLKTIAKGKPDWTRLTKREIDCAYHFVMGKTNKEIAILLNISHRTVEEYSNNIKRKMNCRNKAELIATLCQCSLGVFPTS
jgi:DNA-binding CsgD family transcriptional regulator